MIASRSSTSPMIVIASACSLLELRRLSTMASSARRRSATSRAFFAPPTSVATITGRGRLSERKYSARCGCACSSSSGMLKKPWICPAWRSIVSTRSAPATSMKFATRRAVMGTRGWSFLSERPYAKYGITAVMRPAEARLAASIMMNSSMRRVFTGGAMGWIRKTSRSRDVVQEAHEDVAVGELEHLVAAEGHLEVPADSLGERTVRVSAEHRHLAVYAEVVRARSCLHHSVRATCAALCVSCVAGKLATPGSSAAGAARRPASAGVLRWYHEGPRAHGESAPV